LVKLTGANDKYLIAANQHRGDLKLFELNKRRRIVRVNSDDRSALLKLSNGKIQKQELNQGSSFLSQSAGFLSVGDLVTSVQITNNRGAVRNILFDAVKEK
jgi:hypothetical protein